jgi:hypothetical protein
LSLATSTTATRSPAEGTSVGETNATAAADVTVALTAARDALDDRRIFVTSVADLSALAGARAGMIGVTL